MKLSQRMIVQSLSKSVERQGRLGIVTDVTVNNKVLVIFGLTHTEFHDVAGDNTIVFALPINDLKFFDKPDAWWVKNLRFGKKHYMKV
jgi:hypothetical protein